MCVSTHVSLMQITNNSDSKCAHFNSINVIQYSTVLFSTSPSSHSLSLFSIFRFLSWYYAAAIIHLLFHLQYENIIWRANKLIRKEFSNKCLMNFLCFSFFRLEYMNCDDSRMCIHNFAYKIIWPLQ